MLVFTKEPGERLKFVCQTGGKNAHVKWVVEGLESVLYSGVLFNNPSVKLSDKGIIYVFSLKDNRWLGSIRKVNGVPKKEPADEELYFKDFYTQVGD